MKRISSPITKYIILLFGAALLCFSACKKQDDWLNVKNKKSDVTPKTLADFQALLDNTNVFNAQGSNFGLAGSDNLYVPDANLDAESQVDRNVYLWAPDIYQGSTAYDWLYDYQEIEYANIVLDGLNTLDNATQNTATAKNIKGEALFYRTYGFYQLSQLYCKPYIKSTATADLGFPLRLTSDVNQKVGRNTVEQCYTQMITDLQLALSLLPSSPLYKTRPATTAANALMSKIYFSMADYVNAYQYADNALKSNGTLLDFNTLNLSSTAPFPSYTQGNPEIIFYAYCASVRLVGYSSANTGRVSPDLYSNYADGDLRKLTYFLADGKGYYRPKAGYSVNGNIFCGIANNELYLIRAECAARNGNITGALADINSLLKKRLTPATYTAVTVTDPTALLPKVLLERQKELVFTGNLRWEDLRRLNQDTRFAKSLQRTSHNVNYTLPPNDNRYVFPIPPDEITLENLQQNPR